MWKCWPWSLLILKNDLGKSKLRQMKQSYIKSIMIIKVKPTYISTFKTKEETETGPDVRTKEKAHKWENSHEVSIPFP